MDLEDSTSGVADWVDGPDFQKGGIGRCDAPLIRLLSLLTTVYSRCWEGGLDRLSSLSSGGAMQTPSSSQSSGSALNSSMVSGPSSLHVFFSWSWRTWRKTLNHVHQGTLWGILQKYLVPGLLLHVIWPCRTKGRAVSLFSAESQHVFSGYWTLQIAAFVSNPICDIHGHNFKAQRGERRGYVLQTTWCCHLHHTATSEIHLRSWLWSEEVQVSSFSQR